jgi:hypothetical protein
MCGSASALINSLMQSPLLFTTAACNLSCRDSVSRTNRGKSKKRGGGREREREEAKHSVRSSAGRRGVDAGARLEQKLSTHNAKRERTNECTYVSVGGVPYHKCVEVAHERGANERRLSLDVGRIHVGALVNKLPHALHLPFIRRPLFPSHTHARTHARTVSSCEALVGLRACAHVPVERSGACAVLGVDRIGAPLQEQSERFQLPLLRCPAHHISFYFILLFYYLKIIN